MFEVLKKLYADFGEFMRKHVTDFENVFVEICGKF